MKQICATIVLALVTACSGFPTRLNPEQSAQRQPGETSFKASFTPKEPMLGESLSIHYSDFPDGDYDLWLEKHPDDNTDPRTKVGSLVIHHGKGGATVELKPEMGIDQYGKPFTLSAGEPMQVVLIQPGVLSFFTPPITIR